MAAFHPATVRLLREQQRQLVAQHARDVGRRARLSPNSASLMAQQLDERASSATEQIRDLDRLIRFAEGVNEAAEIVRSEHVEPVAAADLGPEYSDGYPLPGEGEAGQ